MFSSFNSFLPSVFQPNQDARSPQPTPQEEIEEPEQTNVEPSDHPSTIKKREKKEKPTNETFIVVRPPPSKTNHPLNLQVQLVPPNSRQDRRSGSLASLDPATAAGDQAENGQPLGQDLQRVASNRSDTSAYSGYASGTASVSSFASTSTSSSRRMIIPLYNLQAHNVLQNIIVDAGTDAKVAKFGKRGMEIVGLAFLEPTEVWGSHSLPGALPAGPAGNTSTRASLDEPPREFSLLPKVQPATALPATPERPSTATGIPQRPSIPPTPSTGDATPTPENTQQKSSKKLFSRMFRRKDQARPPSVSLASNADLGASLSPQPRGLLSRPSVEVNRNSIAMDQGIAGDGLPTTTSMASASALCPAVLGVQPTLYPPIFPPRGRPTKYVWVVRKWLKGTDNGILNGMMGKLSVGTRADSGSSALPHVEVRIEWTRKKDKNDRRDKKARKGTLDIPSESQTVSRRGSTALSSDSHSVADANGNGPVRAEHVDDLLDSIPRSRKKRRQSVEHQSLSSGTGGSDDHEVASSAAHGNAYDSGDETDPEDSDTPWSCTLSMARVGPLRGVEANGQGAKQSPAALRLKVAMLSPTPHHPKVVSLLKVPFPLPDVEVDSLTVRKRTVTPQGVMRTVSDDVQLVLTAEEIKDTISTTALWLVVRESFGGVGRERRKGDGWRIRG
ncbi:hypothetical protein CONPUDRAFT_129926 [Coniophora puteana RWD-64-598 SS2]|uniref:Uncharacterized protein n=1 Tax=Coniophora puteana (strain RWD-64-598) TaxID=741705 RepID=A0A5M3MCR4_CONPW|nr:uncharacterized protein CONPUDRAFT_129926 [Coniophora puteana RWD-64-598 SS2]EIW76640.1 hypothetical protein CONPUDRAFT_129926 [Coniophora puteana RWD-64-598 SS2]